MKIKIIQIFNKRNNKDRKKSYRKKRQIFASAVLAGNLLFRNLKTNDLKTQNYSIATALSHERVILNQELNILEDSHNSGITVQTGNDTILEFQQEVFDTSSTDIDEIISVKDDGILPGADGFPLSNNLRRRHPFGRPRMRYILPLMKSSRKYPGFSGEDDSICSQRPIKGAIMKVLERKFLKDMIYES